MISVKLGVHLKLGTNCLRRFVTLKKDVRFPAIPRVGDLIGLANESFEYSSSNVSHVVWECDSGSVSVYCRDDWDDEFASDFEEAISGLVKCGYVISEEWTP